MQNGILIDMIGWLGAVFCLYAYLKVSTNQIKGDSFKYQLCNIAGACCLIINTSYHGALPSVVVNVIWVAIGLYAIIKTRVLTLQLIRRNKLRVRG